MANAPLGLRERGASGARVSSESGLAGFSGFRFFQLAPFAITENPDNRRARVLSESGFTGLAGFSGFHFSQLAPFAITENPAKANMNTDERPPNKHEPAES